MIGVLRIRQIRMLRLLSGVGSLFAEDFLASDRRFLTKAGYLVERDITPLDRFRRGILFKRREITFGVKGRVNLYVCEQDDQFKADCEEIMHYFTECEAAMCISRGSGDACSGRRG